MKLPNASVHRVLGDLEKADLGGDPRRTRRLMLLVSKIAKQPQSSLPDALGSEAQLEGAYRFVNNESVTMAALHAAHAEQTALRARTEGPVLAIHDTTPLECPHADPQEVGYLNTGKPGFYTHYTLIVGAQSRRPLGVSHLETIVRKRRPRKRSSPHPKRRRCSGAETRKKANRDFERWQRGIDATARSLGGCDVIHVADREVDSYGVFANCSKANQRFVFRVRIGERNARLENGERGSLQELAARSAGVLSREVPLATRAPRTVPTAARLHPPRKARLATLHFSATRMEICRPNYLGKSFPAALALNVVRVWEPHPPRGEKPVEWLLYTSEPVDTTDQVAAIVDAYRARWLIEECNKALKSGCLIEERQFESLPAMQVMLAISLPIACEVLALRAGAREDRERPATDVLSPLQITILRRLGSRTLSKDPTAHDVLLAVAAMGGHQRSNGDPGWLVLQRGMRRLLDYETGWRAAHGTQENL